MSQTPVVIVDDLSKTYRDGWLRRRRVEALKGVSFEVAHGEIFGLLGPNGAGKTTLIKILLGIVRKGAGRAVLLGRSAGDRRGRRSVGYLPESHRIPRHLTGNTALEYYGSLSGLSISQIKAKRADLLRAVGLEEWGRTAVKKYSKGMLQRLGLAQAMMHDPDLLILDEPTDGVDPVGRSEMRQILQRLKADGKSIFLNSHLLQEVELVCDRVGILVEGVLRHVGGVDEITSHSGRELVFNLQGADAQIRGALAEQEITSFKELGSDRFQLGVRVADQTAVNRTIDALRQAGVGIHSMTPRRLTLEQAFLRVVQSKPADWAQLAETGQEQHDMESP